MTKDERRMGDGESSVRTILRVDAGADHRASVSRRLADELLDRIAGPGDTVVRRDVSAGLPFVDAAWVDAAYGGADPAALALSDELVDELLAADELVLVAPVYNFAGPAALKAWIDQVARAERTYRFTPTGVEGLLRLQRAWLVTASGGTEIGSPLDFHTPYVRTLLQFLGVTDVRVIAADQLRRRGDAAYDGALAQLDEATR